MAWNEAHENQVLAVCGNGSLKMFDVTLQVSRISDNRGEEAGMGSRGIQIVIEQDHSGRGLQRSGERGGNWPSQSVSRNEPRPILSCSR